MRRTLGAAFAVAAIAIAAACSSFDDADTPATATDGGSDATSDAGPVTTSDAGAAGDAKLDANHTFFDDFDDGPLGMKWTATVNTAPATLAFDGTRATSAPRSLLASLPAGDAGYVTGSYLMKRFSGSTKSLSCRVKMYVEDNSDGSEPSILDMKFLLPPVNNLGETSVELSIASDHTSLAINEPDAGGSSYPRADVGLPLGKWLDVVFSIDADARTVAVTVDDAPWVSGTFPAAVRPNLGFEIKLGLFAVVDTDAVRLSYDDFACDVELD